MTWRRKKTYKKKVTEKMTFAKHGFSTNPQLQSYLGIGSLFWLTIILLTNLHSLEKSRAVTTFLTSTCNHNYKKCVRIESSDICGSLMKQCYETKKFILPQAVSKIEREEKKVIEFTEEENEINLQRCKKRKFYDQKICRHLCSSTLLLETTRDKSVPPCESVCYELTRSFKSAGEVCPFQKYCEAGCPCPFYECEKFNDGYQRLIPVFDLRKSETIQLDDNKDALPDLPDENFSVEWISGRWKHRKSQLKKFKMILSDFTAEEEPVKIDVSDSFFPYSAGATFLNGKHYLVDAIGNFMIIRESGDQPTFIANLKRGMGFFVFHFGSSIGTHHIEIPRKEEDTKIFPVVVICSPTGRSDKCYYFPPDYNLNRFEEAQGFIASNHFNVKTSSVSYNGLFYLMSLGLGERWIKLSTTMALNRIRKSEEMEKGWRKNEIALPSEFRDMDPVHIVPLIRVKE